MYALLLYEINKLTKKKEELNHLIYIVKKSLIT